MALLKFPLNDDEVNYPARVTFEVLETEGADFSASFGGLLEALSNTFFDGDSDIDASAIFAHTGGLNTTRPGFGSNVRAKPNSRCVLFLPQAVNIQDAVTYNENVEFGALGAAAEAGIKAGGNLGAELAQAATRGIGSITNLFTAQNIDTDVARLGVAAAAKRFTPQAVQNVVESATQVRANPNTRAMFRSVNIRNFSFTFKMIPTSPEETQSIKAIIKYFRTELYPEAITLQELANVEAGYKFPNLFDIKFDYRGKQIGTKLLPCYLRNVSVVYNASGMGFMEGGDFSEVDITLSFVESSTLTKQLVQEQDY